jgi:hypothetical protein
MSAELPFFALSFSTSFAFFSISWNANKNFESRLLSVGSCFFSVVIFCSTGSFLGLGLDFTGGFALLNRISMLRRFPLESKQGRYWWGFLGESVERGG